MGVLARECEPFIGYVCAEEGETSLAPVPSRNDCRLTGLFVGIFDGFYLYSIHVFGDISIVHLSGFNL